MLPVIADRQQKLLAVKGDTSMRPLVKMRRMKEIFEDSDKKINAIPNDQQKQQYAHWGEGYSFARESDASSN